MNVLTFISKTGEVMNKQEKKLKLKAWKQEKKIEFEKSLPMNREIFEQLFEYLDKKLNNEKCLHNLSLTKEFLIQNNILQDNVINWLKENGGYCDCEVLYNIEEKFFDDAIL